MQHLDYTALFRTAAEQHVDLRHSATDMHFARVTLVSWPTTTLDIQEFTNAQNNKLRTPVLLLESYDARYQENSADNIRKLAHAAFIVLEKPRTASYDDRDQAIQTCERIGEEVLGFAIEHYRKQRLKLDASTISTQKVGPISGGLWGVRFDFQLPDVANNPLAYQAAKFLS